MPLFGLIATPRPQAEPQALMRRGVRLALAGLGLVIMAAGVLAFIAFFHTPGILLFALGLVLVLRNSFSARRTFIKVQRRHPKIFHPIRRLIRREPEVVQVIWQQTLRLERLVLPARWRFCKRLRMKLMRRGRWRP